MHTRTNDPLTPAVVIRTRQDATRGYEAAALDVSRYAPTREAAIGGALLALLEHGPVLVIRIENAQPQGAS